MPVKTAEKKSQGRRDPLPRPTTFFLTEQQHRAVLRVLRAHDKADRSRALCKALRIKHEG